jgi:AcrR family transcriptional regulator
MSDVDKREVIIQSALAVFVEKGFYNAKISDIAEKAGIGKGTIYEYFASKKEIFEEAFTGTIVNNYEKSREILNKKTTFREKLANYFEYKYNCITIQRSLAENFLAHGELISRNIKKIFFEQTIKHNEDLRQLIHQGIDEKIVRANIDKDMMVSCILGVSNTYLGTWVFMKKEGAIDYNKMIDSILDGFGEKREEN